MIAADPEFSIAEAIAITDGRIVRVGTTSDVLEAAGTKTRVVDLEGRTVLPGLVDPHVHYIQHQTPDVENMVEDQRILLSWGRTTVGIPAAIPINLTGYQRMLDAGELKLRLHAYLSWNNNCGEPEDVSFWNDYTFTRSAEHRLAIAGVKVFMDGGSCRAPAVSFDFDDAPIALPEGWAGHGDLFTSAEELAEVVRLVGGRGGQVVAHAIGDRAVAAALDGYAQALGGGPNPNGHRIDHITFVRPEQVGRFGALRVNAVVWGVFNACIEPDLGWASFLDDDQRQWLRQHRAVIDGNPDIAVAFHSDVPWTEGSPFHQLLGLTAMAQYDDAFGGPCPGPAWLSGHEVTVPEAIRMMTISAARVMGIADEVGSIEVGKRADLVVFANNPLGQSGFELLDNHVSATLIDGDTVWCDDAWCR
ncbi:MAG TPA: amidohydrolase family protein [Longimicrobiales bacterium]